MSITAGSRLGPYEVVSSIGAGGMGEVWRARDTRLDRDVAIKVLPATLSISPELRSRFEREARTISQLNHPHVCVLYDVGEAKLDTGGDGDAGNALSYLVMELLEGDSLVDRLKRGPLPLQEVLQYGQQIASALDAAHRRGVVHRDLKPGNVMITKSGAKLLDFGLAKAGLPGQSPIEGLTNVATEAKPLTQEGTILGTFQYMAPEQLEGLEADARTDIFALGCLLYEMATGQRAFRGTSKTSLIAAIVSATPEPISAVMPMTPPALDHVVRRCLEKDPDDRWQSAHDVARELQWISEAGSQVGVSKAAVSARRTTRRLLTVAAVVGWIIAAGALMWSLDQRSILGEAIRPFRAELVPPKGSAVAFVAAGSIAISPDGSSLAMIAVGRQSALFIRDLGSGATAELPGTENATFPFWSPDSRWIGFFADGKLKKVQASGGPVQTIADAPQGRGGTWSSDGTIVYAPDIKLPLFRVTDSGGKAETLTRLESETWTHRNPQILPGGDHVLYVARESRSQATGMIRVTSLKDGATQTLLEAASNPQYANGYLFWVSDGNLLAQPFDPESIEISGKPVPIAERVEYYNPRDIGNFSVSPAGVLAWKEESRTPVRLARLDRNGREVETFEAGFYSIVDFSRDGRNVLVAREDSSRGGTDLWLVELDRRQMSRATFTSSAGLIVGAFSPDGRRIAVSSMAGSGGWSGAQLWIQSASGGGGEERLFDSRLFVVHQWSPDGKFLVGTLQDTGTAHDIVYLSLDQPQTVVKFLASPYAEHAPRLSPDGRWIAYVSDQSGRPEIYVSNFPEGNRKRQISRAGVNPMASPEWDSNGTALYYVTREGLVVVPVTRSQDDLLPGAPVQNTFDTSKLSSSRFRISGDTILTLVRDGDQVIEPVRIVRNWRHLVEEKR